MGVAFLAFKACSMHLWSSFPELYSTGHSDKQFSRPERDAASLHAYIVGLHCSSLAVIHGHTNHIGSNGSERVSHLLMPATISCMLVILLIAIELVLTLMGIRQIEGSYGTVRSSDKSKINKALFETPDC